MGSHHLVLQPLPEVLEGILHAVAVENVQVLDTDLVVMWVDLHVKTFLLVLLDQSLLRVCVKQVEDLLLVKLNILHLNIDFHVVSRGGTLLFDLLEEFADSSRYHTLLRQALLSLWIVIRLVSASVLIDLRKDRAELLSFKIFVALHGERFTTSSLSIDEDSGVEATQHLLNQITRSRAPKDTFLRRHFTEHLVKAERLDIIMLIYYPMKKFHRVNGKIELTTLIYCPGPSSYRGLEAHCGRLPLR